MQNDPRSLQTEDPASSPSTRERPADEPSSDAQSSNTQSSALSRSSSTSPRPVLRPFHDLDGVTLDAEDASPEILPPHDRCANCGTQRTGRYCSTCGQRHLDGRLSVRQLVRDFLARIFDLESGLLHTVWRLTLAPGSVPRDYVVGRRSRYVRPGTYFVLISALSVLLFPLMKTSYVAYLQGAFDPILASGSLTGLDEDQFMDTLVDWTGRSSMYMSLLLTAIYVPVVRWVVPGWRARYNIAETFVFGIYTMAHATLLCLPLRGAISIFGPGVRVRHLVAAHGPRSRALHQRLGRAVSRTRVDDLPDGDADVLLHLRRVFARRRHRRHGRRHHRVSMSACCNDSRADHSTDSVYAPTSPASKELATTM